MSGSACRRTRARRPPPPATGAALRLSDEQRVVAHAPIDEALAVVAAAGTGKTHTMTGRARFLLGQVRKTRCHVGPAHHTCDGFPPLHHSVCWTLAQGVAAEEVLVLTLSRKAAGEFRERLLRHVPGAKAATVCTFHSWCGGWSQQPGSLYSAAACMRCALAGSVHLRHCAAMPCRSWMVVWRHWREAGFERRPTILAAEQQELALMRDCIM